MFLSNGNGAGAVTSASIFWVICYLVTLVGLLWIAIWAYFNNSIKGAIIAIIFFMMLTTSFVLSRRTLFQAGTWQQNAASFSLGFLIWAFIAGRPQSILSVAQNDLFASIASELPEYLEFIMNTFVIPIAEESLWIIALPDVLTFLMNQTAKDKRFGFFSNKVLQLAVIIVVGSVTFAVFHIGNLAIMSFIIAAIVFRTAMLLFVVGDSNWNLLPFISVVPAFAVGAHIANNWAAYGFGDGVQLLLQNISTGWIVFLFLGIIFLSAIEYFFGIFLKWFDPARGG